jgi:hypothetical protein
MNEIQQLKHRLAMVLDDITVIRQHIYTQNISRCFEEPTPIADECWTHLNNIEIACDLNSEESLTWRKFKQSDNNKNMTKLDLQSLDRDYFWVQRPKAIINELNKHFSKVEDVTYLNDTCPSVQVNDRYLVMLPNSTRLHDEETNQYLVCFADDYSNLHDGNYKIVDTLDQVIDEIEDLKSKDKSLEALLFNLDESAQELINSGDSHDIREGKGMLRVIRDVQHNLKQSKDII